MCVRCRRHLLAGERYRLWQADRPAPRAVCGLCEEDVRRAGWLRVTERPVPERPAGTRGSVRLVA